MLSKLVIGSVLSFGLAAVADESCALEVDGDETCALQVSSRKSGICTFDQHVQCPGSSSYCSGNQCCPGTAASGGQTFPCPSSKNPASANCQKSEKVENCLAASPSPAPTCASDQIVQCPGSDEYCTGSNCCPGTAASGWQTFPCPSSPNPAASNCQRPDKVENCLASSAALLQAKRHQAAANKSSICTSDQHVQCPGSNSYCTGDQCCPGTAASGGQTFPCPSSANPASASCQKSEKVENCLACASDQIVQCPGSDEYCTGSNCCPGTAASGWQTFPCPSSPNPEASNCQRPDKIQNCLASSAAALQTTKHQVAAKKSSICARDQIVQCPGSNQYCTGSNCCPGTAASGWQTFPCPSSPNPAANNCQSPDKVENCLTR